MVVPTGTAGVPEPISRLNRVKPVEVVAEPTVTGVVPFKYCPNNVEPMRFSRSVPFVSDVGVSIRVLPEKNV